VSERLADYDYALPPALIAQRPAPRRDGCRLLVLDRASGACADRAFTDLPDLLAAGDLLVLNDTRVLPARLLGRREGGAAAEVLLAGPSPSPGPSNAGRWLALVRPAKRFKPGDRFTAAGGVRLRVEEAAAGGQRWVALESPASWDEAMAAAGAMPLPPYIARPADALDTQDYQTVFARAAGAVAAPTAGLHFTTTLLAELRRRGVEQATCTLHVGIGTFQPLRVEDPACHRMHPERFILPARARRAVDRTQALGRRVIAVGTTAVRVLETPDAASWDGDADLAGETELFIRPPATIRRADALLTNFHLPRSTLLMLVSAFAGRERVLAAYRHAVGEGYRFYSYGDAMLIGEGLAGASAAGARP
jgi:S-adenosylmethionine:tRNA ribosyltransferase-isomerase